MLYPIFYIFFFCVAKSDDPVALSRWERVEESDPTVEEPKEKRSKWEKVEGVKLGKSNKSDDDIVDKKQSQLL